MGETRGIDHSKMEGTREIPKDVPPEEGAIRLQRAKYQGDAMRRAHPAGEGGLGVLGRLAKRNAREGEIIHEDAIAENEARKKAANV